VPGLDGQKMSKSYGNTLEIFGDEKALRKKVMSIVMDSRTPAEPKPDAEQEPLHPAAETRGAGRGGGGLRESPARRGLGYGDLKKALFEHYWNFFAAARARREELLKDPGYVDRVLATARSARAPWPPSSSSVPARRQDSNNLSGAQMTTSVGGGSIFSIAAMMRSAVRA
jgi:tryptophanyl-tRNA synthetase